MSADFWAGYISGAAGIIIGNPLDVLKVRLQVSAAPSGTCSPVTAPTLPAAQAGNPKSRPRLSQLLDYKKLSRGISPPLLTYGPLNALLFVTYNRTLCAIDPSITDPSTPPTSTLLTSIWLAGAIGGLATWVVSTPTESVKCRAQVNGSSHGSFAIARDMWKQGGGGIVGGLRQLYTGGAITSVRDAVGYGFYFWSYELCKRSWQVDDGDDARGQAFRVLVCGGLAGVVTWASIFPLDVVKSRYQTQDMVAPRLETEPLLGGSNSTQRAAVARKSAVQIAREAYRQEGVSVFFRGLGVCSARAFIVNAVQWMVYEWVLEKLQTK